MAHREAQAAGQLPLMVLEFFPGEKTSAQEPPGSTCPQKNGPRGPNLHDDPER